MATLVEKVFVTPSNTQTQSFGFNAQAPLDNRTVLTFDPTDKSEGKLYGIKSTSKTKDGIPVDFYNESLTYLYPGIIISILSGIPSDDKSKTLKTIRLDGKGSEVLQEWAWTELSTGGNLSEYYTKTEVDQKINDLGTVFSYRGSVPDYNSLISETLTPKPKSGDVWNVIAQSTVDNIIYPAGTNFVYVEATEITEAHWDALGGVSAIDELKSLEGTTIDSGKYKYLKIDSNKNISWDDVPAGTTVRESQSADETSEQKYYTIKEGDTKNIVEVYSKDVINALFENLTSSSLVWNNIPDTNSEPTV